jgi:rubredoxin-NAD+ reductase
MNTAEPTPDAQANHGQLPLIIIGAGLAGWSVAREFRKLDADTPVLMITLDSGDFYAKPSLSNAFAQGRAPAQLVSTEATKMATNQNVTLLPHTRVTGVDPESKIVRTSQGEHPYRQLVLATGAQAIRVPLAGDAADQVLSVNSLDDFAAFHARLTAEGGAGRKHVMIMGAGLIGCEFANDLAGAGFKVSVADPSTGPMATLLPPEAGAQLKAALSELGVEWHFGSTVSSVQRSNDGVGSAFEVTLSNAHTLKADAVLSAIGLRADLTLAQAAGLACERGVLVDDSLQTSAPHIYALGDAVQYAGGHVLPYVMPIMHAAKALAQTLTGSATPVVFPLMPVAIKTPALPLVVAPPPLRGTLGQWQAMDTGVWHFLDEEKAVRGFVLAGRATARRAEQSKLVRAH